jgi:hypothetical protein
MLALMLVPATPSVVLGHTGSIKVSQTCTTWSAEVDLANNVTNDRTVVVETSIPGTTGLNAHFDTTGNTGDQNVWSATGPAVVSGTVTLSIWSPTYVMEFSASASLPSPGDCPTPPPTPPTPVVTCGGTVAFSDVPAGWQLAIEPGDLLVTSGFDSIALDPNTYTYEWRDAKANDMAGGKFTIEACPTPTPPVITLQTVCSNLSVTGLPGAVTFSGVPQNWLIIVEPGDLSGNPNVSGMVEFSTLDAGNYAWELRDPKANDIVGGKFTIDKCSVPTPSAKPSAKPSVTLPPTTTDETGTPGSTSTPLFAILICLAFGAFGLAAVQMQRRSIRR